MDRTFFASGGTKLPSSRVYGRNVDPRLLRAYLPKEKRWHEPRDKKVGDDEIGTKTAAKEVKRETAPAAKDDGVIDDDKLGVKLEDMVYNSKQSQSVSRS